MTIILVLVPSSWSVAGFLSMPQESRRRCDGGFFAVQGRISGVRILAFGFIVKDSVEGRQVVVGDVWCALGL